MSLKLWFPRQAWSAGVGDFLQIVSVIPSWQAAHPGQTVVIAHAPTANAEAMKNIPGVEYRETEVVPDTDYLHAFQASPGPPRADWWGRLGLDYKRKRYHYWPTASEIVYAETAWGKQRPRIVVQRSGGMESKLYGSYDAIAEAYATACNVLILDPRTHSRARPPVRRVPAENLRLTLALVATADLFVGFDSGPYYAAIGSLVPSVGIFPAGFLDPPGLYWPVQDPATIAIQGKPDDVPPHDVAMAGLDLLGAATPPGLRDEVASRLAHTRNCLHACYAVRPGTDDSVIAEGHEAHMSQYLTLPDGGIAVVVGAHVGTHVLHLARTASAVLAYEPHPDHAATLRRNLMLNQVDNVDVVESAVSAADGTATLTDAGMGSSIIPGTGMQVRTEALDTRGLYLPRLDLIVIDAEGAENLVLQGARQTLAKHRPRIIVESHGRTEGIGTGPEMEQDTIDRLNDAGYTVSEVCRTLSTTHYEAVPK